jgi:hypothetical protein
LGEKMSEYQYYEFQAIDKPLSEAEQEKISALSSRVQLTPTSAKFVYNYGDFRGDPEKILTQHFDAMLYVANWGTRQLMFRLPRSIIDVDILKPFCGFDIISTRVTANHIILDIRFDDEEGGGWMEGEGWLPSLVLLRRDILRGDLRMLYLAWLRASVEFGEDNDESQLEPPVPAHLKILTTPLKDFVNLFEIDPNLIKAAASASAKMGETDNFMEELEKWVEKLPIKERNHFLVRLAKGETNVDVQLMNRLRELANTQSPQQSTSKRRTVAELEQSALKTFEQKKKRQHKAAEKARIQELEALKPKESETWEHVFELIERKQAKPYDEAVALLVKLHELAEYSGKPDEFKTRMDKLHKQYNRRSALITRLHKVGIITR